MSQPRAWKGGFVADLHFAPSAWRNRNVPRGDAYRAWHAVIEHCISQKLEHLFLGGDIFDTAEADPLSAYHYIAGVMHAREAKVRVWHVRGNHERHPHGTWATIHPEAMSLHRTQLTLPCGRRIIGHDWAPRGDIQDWLQSSEAQVEVLLMHQTWLELGGEIQTPQASFADVPASVQVLLTGDFHGAVHEKRYGSLQVYSPGSISLQSIDEPTAKMFFEIDASPEEWRMRPVPLPSRDVVTLEAVEPGDLADLPGRIRRTCATLRMQRPADQYPLLRLVCPRSLGVSVPELTAAAAPLDLWVTQHGPARETVLVPLADVRRAATLAEHVELVADPLADDGRLLERLLRTDGDKTALTAEIAKGYQDFCTAWMDAHAI